MNTPRLAILIDYQNIHLTGRDVFAPPGTTARDTLVHPVRFTEEVMAARPAAQGDARQRAAAVTAIRLYRNIPSNQREPRLYAASQAQRAEWTRDPRLEAWYRTLRYPNNWPADPAREKGVDVKLAIELVGLATMSHDLDAIVLASHDTDLEPALEMAAAFGRVKIETAGWLGAKRLRVPARRLWHTALDIDAFVRCRDHRKY